MFQQKSLDKSGKVPTLSVIISLNHTPIIMKNSKMHYEKAQRRFCEATDGLVIKKWYATMQTTDLARKMGLTAKQIENYVYRHNTERWAKKKSSYLSKINSEIVKKRWAREKESRNINTNTFLVPDILRSFAAETATRNSGKHRKEILSNLRKITPQYRKEGVCQTKIFTK